MLSFLPMQVVGETEFRHNTHDKGKKDEKRDFEQLLQIASLTIPVCWQHSRTSKIQLSKLLSKTKKQRSIVDFFIDWFIFHPIGNGLFGTFFKNIIIKKMTTLTTFIVTIKSYFFLYHMMLSSQSVELIPFAHCRIAKKKINFPKKLNIVSLFSHKNLLWFCYLCLT